MAEQKEINPILKQVLELGPPLVFFAVYLKMRDNTYVVFGTEYSGFIAATLIFVPILLLAMGALWFLTGKLSRMQVFTAVLVVFLGGLTAYFNDDRFVKIRQTIVFGAFSIVLGIGLLRGKSWLEYIMADMIPMRSEGWMILTKRLCLCFGVLAIANEIAWRTLSTDTWVKLDTFVWPLALMGFMFWQIMGLQEYMIEEDADSDGS